MLQDGKNHVYHNVNSQMIPQVACASDLNSHSSSSCCKLTTWPKIQLGE